MFIFRLFFKRALTESTSNLCSLISSSCVTSPRAPDLYTVSLCLVCCEIKWSLVRPGALTHAAFRIFYCNFKSKKDLGVALTFATYLAEMEMCRNSHVAEFRVSCF